VRFLDFPVLTCRPGYSAFAWAVAEAISSKAWGSPVDASSYNGVRNHRPLRFEMTSRATFAMAQVIF